MGWLHADRLLSAPHTIQRTQRNPPPSVRPPALCRLMSLSAAGNVYARGALRRQPCGGGSSSSLREGYCCIIIFCIIIFCTKIWAIAANFTLEAPWCRPPTVRGGGVGRKERPGKFLGIFELRGQLLRGARGGGVQPGMGEVLPEKFLQRQPGRRR